MKKVWFVNCKYGTLLDALGRQPSRNRLINIYDKPLAIVGFVLRITVDYFTKAHEKASLYHLKYRLSPLETIKNRDTNMVVF